MRRRSAERKFVLVAVLLAFVASISALSAGELLLHWPLDEPLGSEGRDASGHGHTCILPEGNRHHRGPFFRPGKGWHEGAVDLGSRHSIYPESAIKLPPKWTLSFFFRHRTPRGRQFVRFGNLTIALGGDTAQVTMKGLGKGNVHRFTANRWEHMGIAVQPGSMTVYVNGKKATTKTKEGWQFSGKAKLSFNSIIHGSFRGLVDDVRLDEGVLPAKKIAALADGIYAPGAAWIGEYGPKERKLINAGHLNRPEIDRLIDIGAPDIASMIDVLRTGDGENRIRAAFSLGVVHNQQAVKALMTVLDSDGDGLVRQAVESVGRVQDPDALSDLVEMMAHSSEKVRREARQAVAGYGDSAVPLLRKKLRSRNQRIAEGAGQVLQQLQVKPSGAENELRRLILKKQWNAIRKRDISNVTPLAEALYRTDHRQARLAANELALRGKQSVDVLLGVLNNGESFARRMAARTLGTIGDPRAAKLLAKQLTTDDYALQEECARALQYIAGPDQIPQLVAVLDSPHGPSRGAAARGLVQIGKPAVKPLMKLLNGDGGGMFAFLGSDETISSETRRAAIRALGQTGHQKAAEVLVQELNADDRMVRATAAEALGLLPEPPFRPLKAALGDPDWHVRWKAVRGLQELNTYDAREALGAAQEDPHPLVRQALEDKPESLPDDVPTQELKDLQHSEVSADRIRLTPRDAVGVGVRIDWRRNQASYLATRGVDRLFWRFRAPADGLYRIQATQTASRKAARQAVTLWPDEDTVVFYGLPDHGWMPVVGGLVRLNVGEEYILDYRAEPPYGNFHMRGIELVRIKQE